MCGIAGVSFAPGSTINRHKLAAALLKGSETRGRDASGFAWVGPTGTGMYKKDLPGSKLHVGRIPSNASSIIMHTRASTHGHPSDNDNNHPIETPDGSIRLVHNGVIWNHEDVRALLPKEVSKALPEVDSSVIGAIITTYGLDSTDVIAGDAACAWFDTDTGDTIHLARFSNSPVSVATLVDGSFVFASTPSILAGALENMGLKWVGSWPTPFEVVKNGGYLQIMGGEIISDSDVEWDDDYYYSSSKRDGWRTVTAGGTTSNLGKGSESTQPMALAHVPQTTTAPAASTTLDLPMYLGDNEGDGQLLTEEDYDIWVSKNELPKDFATPEYQRKAADQLVKRWADVTPASESDEDEEVDTEDSYDYTYGYYGDDPDMPENVDYDEPTAFFGEDKPPVFYTLEHSGDFNTYNTLSALIASTVWISSMSAGEDNLVGPEEGNLRWVNHFGDIGVLSQKEDMEVSWVRDSNAFEMFMPFLPMFVHEGVMKLRQLVGA